MINLFKCNLQIYKSCFSFSRTWWLFSFKHIEYIKSTTTGWTSSLDTLFTILIIKLPFFRIC